MLGAELCTVLEPGNFGKIIKYLKTFWCVVVKDGKKSVGPIAWKMQKYYTVNEERNILQTMKNEG